MRLIQIHSFLRRKIERKYIEKIAIIVYDVLTPDFMKARIEMLMLDLNKQANTTENHYSHEDKEEKLLLL